MNDDIIRPLSSSSSLSRPPTSSRPLGDHAFQNSLPGDAVSKDKSQYRSSRFSIPRKPVGNVRSSSDSSDRKGSHECVVSGELPKQCGISRQPGLLRIWWLELLSCVLFITAFVAIVVTIYPYEGRQLPQWPYRLSINSLISIYVVILKAGILLVSAEGLSQLKWRWFDNDRQLKDLLIYDNASRGPWGSFTLIWRLRGRGLVASCGAIITVAALIIDPFA